MYIYTYNVCICIYVEKSRKYIAFGYLFERSWLIMTLVNRQTVDSFVFAYTWRAARLTFAYLFSLVSFRVLVGSLIFPVIIAKVSSLLRF